MADVGQLIVTGIGGCFLTEQEKSFLESENIGGVILFSRNYESPAQLAELVNSVQVLRKEYPLFISVDHEGGRVIRFKNHFTQFPAMFEIARTSSPKLCYQVHKIMAEELSACGINLNFSPVCDVWTNPANKVIGDRSFGTEPDTVSKYISAAIRGMQTNNIISCAKHFPGHGSSTKDSHFDLPIIKTSFDDLWNVELVPFIKAVKSRVEMVMMAHIIVDAIESELPCSLSARAHDILRKELKYSKVIVSDDMQMKAITDHFSVEKAAVMALAAGTDLLIYRDMEQAQQALIGIKEATKVKELKNSDIEQKIERIIKCKKSYLKDYRPIYIPGIVQKINNQTSQVFLAEIMSRLTDQSTQL